MLEDFIMKKIILAAIILTLGSSLFAAKDETVVATVNGKPIYKSEFDEAYKQNQLFVSKKPVTKEKVLYDLINRKLGVTKAMDAKIDSDPVVKQKMEDVMYHAQISKDLEPMLKKIKVTDDDVKNYYKDNPEYRTAHILFRVRVEPSKDETEAAQKQAFKVYDSVMKKPDSFAKLANKYSQSSTAPNGGDLGFQPSVRLAPQYFKAIKGKPVGHITAPIRTQFGYHIIKVLAVKDYKSINTALYKKLVYDSKRDAILEKYFEGLRKDAKITINKKSL